MTPNEAVLTDFLLDMGEDARPDIENCMLSWLKAHPAELQSLIRRLQGEHVILPWIPVPDSGLASGAFPTSPSIGRKVQQWIARGLHQGITQWAVGLELQRREDGNTSVILRTTREYMERYRPSWAPVALPHRARRERVPDFADLETAHAFVVQHLTNAGWLFLHNGPPREYSP